MDLDDTKLDEHTSDPPPARRLAIAAMSKRLFPDVSASPKIGRFTVLRLLGEGGMGAVFSAYDDQLDRKIAVKLIRARDQATADADSVVRLLREAQGLARLSHPNVVQVHDVGEHQGSVYVAMEYVEGETLRDWLDDRRRPWGQRLGMLIQAGRGLEAAHAAGLVHRDFKPDNVMVGIDGRARVLDFGLVRADASALPQARGTIDESLETESTTNADADAQTRTNPPLLQRSLTARGTMLGTPAYMAPEQHRGQACTALADQFAFCVTAFEALFGVRPFGGRNYAELAAKVGAGEREPIPAVGVPRRVREAVLRGLEVEPIRRWASMTELLDELESAYSGRRRRWIAGSVLAAVAVAGSLALGFRLGLGEPATMCAIDDHAFAQIWDGPRREALREELASESTFEFVAEHIDGWTRAWHEARVSACEATRVNGVQSESVLDLRTACLDRKRRELDLLLASIDDVVAVAWVPELLAELPALEECADVTRLLEVDPLPEDPKRKQAILAAYDELTEIRIQAHSGRFAVATNRAVALEQRAGELGYRPLAIEVGALVGQIELARGRVDRGVAPVVSAAREAAAQNLDELAAELLVEAAAAAAGYWSKPELERWLLEEADAALRRLGRTRDPREVSLRMARAILRAQEGDFEAALAGLLDARALAIELGSALLEGPLQRHIGSALYSLNRLDEARAEFESGRALALRRFGPSSPSAALFEYDLAALDLAEGEIERGAERLGRAEGVFRIAFGGDSLELAALRFAQADVRMAAGDYAGALALIDECGAIRERELGPDDIALSEVHEGRGVMLYFLADYGGSIRAYQRAMEVAAITLGPGHPTLGRLHGYIGESQLELGDTGPALASFAAALENYARTLHDDHPDLAIPLKGLGKAQLALGHASQAISTLERALGILVAANDYPLELADIRFTLARALVEAGEPKARAVGLARLAREGFAASANAAAVDAWLRDHSP